MNFNQNAEYLVIDFIKSFETIFFQINSSIIAGGRNYKLPEISYITFLMLIASKNVKC